MAKERESKTEKQANKSRLRISIDCNLKKLEALGELLRKDKQALKLLEHDPEEFIRTHDIKLDSKVSIEGLKQASSQLQAALQMKEPVHPLYVHYVVAATVDSFYYLFCVAVVPLPPEEG